nr:retrovirus-related Pol polyprotein from transposon TNT 1-94 [Tanacetum cinerariifolium]
MSLIRNEDLRTELEHYCEEYDEEREMEPRHARARETTLVLRIGSPMKSRRQQESWGNLPPLLASHLGRNENGQPLQLTLTSAYGGHQPSTNSGGNLTPNGMHLSYNAPPFIPNSLQPSNGHGVNSFFREATAYHSYGGHVSEDPIRSYGPTPIGFTYPSSSLPNSYPFYTQPINPLPNAPLYPNYNPTCLFTDFTGCVTPFVYWIKDYPLLDGLKMPSHVGSYDGKEDLDNNLHRIEGSIVNYEDLKVKFWSHFSQQKKFTKTHLAVHNIKQRDGESTRAFVTRYTDDTLQILGLHEKHHIFGFVHGLKTRSLMEFLSTNLPTTYKGLMDKTYTWIEAKEPSIRSLGVNYKLPLVGFSGEHFWPLREVPLEITIGEGPFTRTEILNFIIVRSNSPHNLLLGITVKQKMGIILSTIYEAIEFHTPYGIGTILSTYEPNKVNDRQKKLKETPKEATKDVLCYVDAKERFIFNEKHPKDLENHYGRREALQHRAQNALAQAHRTSQEKEERVQINIFPSSKYRRAARRPYNGQRRRRGLLKNEGVYGDISNAYCPIQGKALGVTRRRAKLPKTREAHTSPRICCKRLQIYFQAHLIRLLTDKPIKKILTRPEKSRRIAKWAIKLGEHDIKFKGHNSVKGHVLADFLAKMPSTGAEYIEVNKTKATIKESELKDIWKLYTDRASSSNGLGVSLMLVSPDGKKYTYALRFEFITTNSEAEYEALLAGLRIAVDMKVKDLSIFVDSQLVANQVNGLFKSRHPVIKQYLDKKKESLRSFNNAWYTPILYLGLPSSSKWTGRGYKSRHRKRYGAKVGKESPRLTYDSKVVIPIEITMKTKRIKEFEGRQNKKRRKEDLDTLEEQRKISSIREAHYKQKLERYYNKCVWPSKFKPGLWCPKDSGFDLTAYSDADHAGCHLDRKSTSGSVQYLCDKLICWSSKKQNYVSISTAKSEYVAVSSCCTQVLWMRTQLTDYGFFYDKVLIYCDSKSAIAISCNSVQHTHTKHIDVRYHFMKDHVEKGTIELYFVGTEYQLADLFTKSLPEARFKFLVEKLGMMSRET